MGMYLTEIKRRKYSCIDEKGYLPENNKTILVWLKLFTTDGVKHHSILLQRNTENSKYTFTPLSRYSCNGRCLFIYVYFYLLSLTFVRHCAVVGRVPVFQPGGAGSIPGGVRNFNFFPGTGCL